MFCCLCNNTHNNNMYQPLIQKRVTFKNEIMIAIVPNEDRRGIWHLMAVDRYRFKQRIKQLEPLLNTMLLKKHTAYQIFPESASTLYYLGHCLAKHQQERQIFVQMEEEEEEDEDYLI
nr:ORF48 [Acipenserid herpesvirus 1]